MAPKRFSLLAVFSVICLLCSTGTAINVLYSGQRLLSGQSLVQGSYSLSMQFDCNLVLYAPSAIWSSGTFKKGVNCYAYLSYYGNLIVYSGAGALLWRSGAARGYANYILHVQIDRNVVIYGPAVWSTRTNLATAEFGPLAINATAKAEGGKNRP